MLGDGLEKRNPSQMSLETILNILQNPTSPADIVYDAAQALRTIEDRRAIEPLLSRLDQGSDPPWVREELVTALGCVISLSGSHSPKAVDLLLEILSSPLESEDIRESSAIALGSIGDVRAVELLLKTLKSGEIDLAFACVVGLSDIGDPRAIDALIEALDMNELLVPQTAAKGLGRFGSAAKRALPALQQLAERGNEAERRFALEAIAAIERALELGKDP
jgi:hypothetical protein